MTADTIALAAMRKRRGMQAILASRLAAQKAMPATALLRGGVSVAAVEASLGGLQPASEAISLTDDPDIIVGDTIHGKMIKGQIYLEVPRHV